MMSLAHSLQGNMVTKIRAPARLAEFYENGAQDNDCDTPSPYPGSAQERHPSIGLETQHLASLRPSRLALFMIAFISA